jgi:hypothetical protein
MNSTVSSSIVILLSMVVGFIVRALKGGPLSMGMFDMFFEEENNYSCLIECIDSH